MIEISLKNMFKLALPISIGMLGLMLMGLEDLMIAGQLGAWATSTVSVTNAVFSFLLVVGIGFVGGVEVLASQAIGAHREGELEDIWVQALWLSIFYSVPVTALGWILAPVLLNVTPDPQAQAHVVSVFRLFILGLWPCLLANICRQLLQAQGITIPGMLVLLASNVVNVFANLVLVLGMIWPESGFGVVGTGFATLLSRVFMAVAMLWVLAERNPKVLKGFRSVDRDLMRRLLSLGIPGSAMMGLEVGVFASVAVMASTLGAVESAAHQTVLNIASMTFMMPMGIASATTVLVGQSFGRQNWGDVKRAANYGVLLSVGFMTCTALAMLLGPRTILYAYTSDESVVALAGSLLLMAGAFQIFDGLQVTLAGALRGLGDARTPMVGNLIAYWLVAFPLAFWLTFRSHWFEDGQEVKGAWLALVVGLICAASIFAARWRLKLRRATSFSDKAFS